MPTGYTANLEGLIFKDFALRCARGMGALVTMRDDPIDAPIPERFEVPPYYAEQLAKAKARRDVLAAMSNDAMLEAFMTAQKERIESARHQIAKINALADQYHTLLLQARAWAPPTPKHQGLKDLMVQQLELTIKHDTSTEYYESELAMAQAQTPEAWFGEEVRKVQRVITYYDKQMVEEADRVEQRNAWIKALRESL